MQKIFFYYVIMVTSSDDELQRLFRNDFNQRDTDSDYWSVYITKDRKFFKSTSNYRHTVGTGESIVQKQVPASYDDERRIGLEKRHSNGVVLIDLETQTNYMNMIATQEKTGVVPSIKYIDYLIDVNSLEDLENPKVSVKENQSSKYNQPSQDISELNEDFWEDTNDETLLLSDKIFRKKKTKRLSIGVVMCKIRRWMKKQ